MKFGINTFLFTSPFTNKSIDLFPKFKEWGFDSVEIALEDPSHIDPSVIRKALDENGIKCGSICAAMGPGRDLRGTAEEQQTAMAYLKSILSMMPTLGCGILIGPLYSRVGRAELVSKEDYAKQWETVAGHLKTLAKYAEELDVKMAIEPLNRYETDFINTCEQGMKMVNQVNSKALTLQLDTYHMNIEEKDPYQAILMAGDKLGHFHACGSDRGTPGGDQINWDRISSALNQVNYEGEVVIESFLPGIEMIEKAASIWRQFEPSQEDIAVKGLKFLRSSLIK